RDTGVVVVLVVAARARDLPVDAVRVGDRRGAQSGGRVDRLTEVHHVVRVALYQQQLAFRADRRHRVQVERGLHRPAAVLVRVVGAAVLVDLPEAAVVGGA